jgi:hypothetical protein
VDLTYFAFADPSGGSSDSFTLAVAHAEHDMVFVDCVREVRAPLTPEAVTAEFAGRDPYGGTWPRERFLTHGVEHQTSVKNKGEVCLETLQLVNSKRVRLLDNQRMLMQFAGLQRRTGSVGRNKIDHALGI